MFRDFRAFIARGNVLDLAVAVVIGAAFTGIVTSLTDDLLMPLIAALSGSPDFSYLFLRLGPLPPGFAGDPTDYVQVRASGVPVLGYGAFLTRLLNFLIVAFVVFLLVRKVNRVLGLFRLGSADDKPAPPPEPAEEVLLLREIRDSLRGGKVGV